VFLGTFDVAMIDEDHSQAPKMLWCCKDVAPSSNLWAMVQMMSILRQMRKDMPSGRKIEEEEACSGIRNETKRHHKSTAADSLSEGPSYR